MDHIDALQAQVVAARRNQILDAATQVFAEKGFHNATIKDIAKAAGIADGTIYNYFDNKTALLLGILDRLNESSRRDTDFAQLESMDVETWTRAYLSHRSEVMQTGAEAVFRALLPEMLINKQLSERYLTQIAGPTFTLAEEYFRQWIAKGLIKDIDPELALRAMSGMFLGVLMLRLLGDPPLQERWDELLNVMTEISLHGLVGGKNEPATDGEHHEA